MPYLKLEHPWVDDTWAPLYIAATPAVIEDSTLEAFLQAQLLFLTHADHPYAWVAIFDRITSFSAKQRAMVAEAEKKTKLSERRWNAGQGYVLTSAFGRGVLKAMQWLSPPVYPYCVVETREEAMRWCTAQLLTRLPRESIPPLLLARYS